VNARTPPAFGRHNSWKHNNDGSEEPQGSIRNARLIF
jgi:hypothetical protein